MNKFINIAQIDTDTEQKEFLAKLNYYYLETRYPKELSEISKQIKKDESVTFYKNTKKILKWLQSKAQQKNIVADHKISSTTH